MIYYHVFNCNDPHTMHNAITKSVVINWVYNYDFLITVPFPEQK